MLATLGALLAVMLPFRAHLSLAIPALVFVLPACRRRRRGFLPGAVGPSPGSSLYDLLLPAALWHAHRAVPQNWVALVVYVVVVLVVARVVTRSATPARRPTGARRGRRLFELSGALIGDLTRSEMLEHIVRDRAGAFSPRWTALVLPVAGPRGTARGGRRGRATPLAARPGGGPGPGQPLPGHLRTPERAQFGGAHCPGGDRSG